ncbi:MAG: hypothetical protein ACR2Q4_02250 [Geminicoccaceae bacterium]
MNEDDDVRFRAGPNIAMKVPPHQFSSTVAFYRDVLRLPQLESPGTSESFAFGGMRLWIDRVERISQAEIWLEIQCDDTEAAARELAAAGVVRCDEIEPLPGDFDGFWITNPGGIVHLIDHSREEAATTAQS